MASRSTGFGRRGRAVTAARATALAAVVAGPMRAGAQVARGASACEAPVPLRDALERIAAVARVRLSYSRELIAVDRLVCAPSSSGNPVAVLDTLLRGTGVEAVSVGGAHIVLAPSAHATGEATGVATRPAVLERIVVTGSPAGAPARALPVALSIVDGAALGTRSQAPLATALDGVVPGLWLWTQPTTSLLARYAALRGASSFGLTTPKLYLDGVEVANPLFVTALTADQVERIEVIRGPQGAALYGADAISGVINVVTRHDSADGARAAFSLRTGVGAARTSSLVPRPALAQDYGATVRAGSGPRTGTFSLSASTLGPVVPGSTARQITAVAGARQVTRGGVLTLTARFADASAPPSYSLVDAARAAPAMGGGTYSGVLTRGSAAADLAASADSTSALPAPSRQHVSELTLAANAVQATGGRWTRTFTAGLDAYRLSGVSSAMAAAISSPLDSAQRAAQGTAARGTLRASSTATFDLARDVAATLTGIADYGVLRDATRLDEPRPVGAGPVFPGAGTGRGAEPGTWGEAGGYGSGYAGGTPATTAVTTLGTAGLVGQTTLAWRDVLFVTAGLRAERNDGFTAASRTALLPSLGVSVVRAAGGATLKVRGAYGRGLRPARTAARVASWHAFGGAALPSALAPEAQTGIEGGADLFVGGADRRTLALHVTGFDQQASGLIQQVARAHEEGARPRDAWPAGARLTAAADAAPWGPGRDGTPRGARHFEYALQNVGAIANRGVEGEAQLRAADGRAGALTLGATATYVNSRVRRTAAGYTGDLRAGDRVLEVPRATLGASATWRRAAWAATVGAARAADWVNYDRLALAGAVTAGRPDDALSGPALRAFWRTYPGSTRLRADVARELTRGVTVTLTGENLLNQQRGEPDDVTVLPGRTLTAGVRARF